MDSSVTNIYDTLFLDTNCVYRTVYLRDDSIPVNVIDSECFDLGVILHFEFDKYTVEEETIPVLDSFALKLRVLLHKHPDMDVALKGSTDCRGSDEYNMSLSAKRAKFVREYLVTHWHVPFDKLTITPLGKRYPRKSCNNCDHRNEPGDCSELDHQANRYVEAMIHYHDDYGRY